MAILTNTLILKNLKYSRLIVYVNILIITKTYIKTRGKLPKNNEKRSYKKIHVYKNVIYLNNTYCKM